MAVTLNPIRAKTFDYAWKGVLYTLLNYGADAKPRGMATKEVVNLTVHVEDARRSLLTIPSRKLAYRFSVAEWLWIWFGRDDVESIEMYNPNIAQFSDDGKTFFGAYGPRIDERWAFCVNSLRFDPDSRQAILPIYRGPTRPTNDTPCTLTIQFLVRDGVLDTIANMRSSDAWLGLPYDIYTFSQLANTMAAELDVKIGGIFMNLASSHIYEQHWEAAAGCLHDDRVLGYISPKFHEVPPKSLKYDLVAKDKEMKPSTERDPWLAYARVLYAKTNKEAREILFSQSSTPPVIGYTEVPPSLK